MLVECDNPDCTSVGSYERDEDAQSIMDNYPPQWRQAPEGWLHGPVYQGGSDGWYYHFSVCSSGCITSAVAAQEQRIGIGLPLFDRWGQPVDVPKPPPEAN